MFRAGEMSCEAKKKSLGLEVIILSAKRSLIFLKDFFQVVDDSLRHKTV